MNKIIEIFVKNYLRKIIPNGWGTVIFGGLAAILNLITFAQGTLIPDLCNNYGLLCDTKVVNILTVISNIIVILLRFDTKTEIFNKK